jgi:hypothetical protein
MQIQKVQVYGSNVRTSTIPNRKITFIDGVTIISEIRCRVETVSNKALSDDESKNGNFHFNYPLVDTVCTTYMPHIAKAMPNCI